MRLASLLLVVLTGCASAPARRPAIAVTVTDITSPEVPFRMPGAVATWTAHGFLLVPARSEPFGRVAMPEAPARAAALFSRVDRAWQRIPGDVPMTGPAFDAAYPLGDGAVILASNQLWRVDVTSDSWTRIEGGPVGRLAVTDHAGRPGAILLYGQDQGACEAWEFSAAGWTQLPSPPCASYVRFTAGSGRWVMFWDEEDRLRGASVAGDDKE